MLPWPSFCETGESTYPSESWGALTGQTKTAVREGESAWPSGRIAHAERWGGPHGPGAPCPPSTQSLFCDTGREPLPSPGLSRKEPCKPRPPGQAPPRPGAAPCLPGPGKPPGTADVWGGLASVGHCPGHCRSPETSLLSSPNRWGTLSCPTMTNTSSAGKASCPCGDHQRSGAQPVLCTVSGPPPDRGTSGSALTSLALPVLHPAGPTLCKGSANLSCMNEPRSQPTTGCERQQQLPGAGLLPAGRWAPRVASSRQGPMRLCQPLAVGRCPSLMTRRPTELDSDTTCQGSSPLLPTLDSGPPPSPHHPGRRQAQARDKSVPVVTGARGGWGSKLTKSLVLCKKEHKLTETKVVQK